MFRLSGAWKRTSGKGKLSRRSRPAGIEVGLNLQTWRKGWSESLVEGQAGKKKPQRKTNPDEYSRAMKTAQVAKALRVLVIDGGGTNVKMLASGHKEPRKYPSGPTMTPRKIIRVVKKSVRDWKFDCVSIGFPGPIINECPLREPHNLGGGWMGFDFRKAFGCPVKIINDAAMQVLGGYQGGRMLFLGLGTGLGAAMIVDGILQPMELADLIYKNGKTYEDYVGLRG
jgi:ROK family